ncbi:MAG TPA: hypothetical protein VMG12_36475 [Polyangiaceae bacterium]|nr:hypothetical protein [Polyangiaceae bacterium]
MTKQKAPSNPVGRERPAFWRNSVYDEPAWVSLAWIALPVLIAATVIFIAVR